MEQYKVNLSELPKGVVPIKMYVYIGGLVMVTNEFTGTIFWQIYPTFKIALNIALGIKNLYTSKGYICYLYGRGR